MKLLQRTQVVRLVVIVDEEALGNNKNTLEYFYSENAYETIFPTNF